MKEIKTTHFNEGWAALFIIMIFLDFFLSCLALQSGNFYELNKFTSFLVENEGVMMGLFWHAIILVVVVETLNNYIKRKFHVENLVYVLLSTVWIINNLFSLWLLSV